jgi:hypothetical protein
MRYLHPDHHGIGGVAVEGEAMVGHAIDDTAEAIASELLQMVVVGQNLANGHDGLLVPECNDVYNGNAVLK